MIQRLLHWFMQFTNRCLVVGFLAYMAGMGLFIWQVQKTAPTITRALKALDIADHPVDGVVILTGGEERVEAGLTCLQKNCAPKALISGVHHDVKKRELLALHKFPASLADKIDLGFGAIDTAGNAQETAKWVRENKMKRVIVITSNYHMDRAMLHLHALLSHDVILEPIQVKPAILEQKKWYSDNQAWKLLFLAYNKYLLTWPEMVLWRYKA
jgi:uncharacterized SAM-binding protein YcdF (DUF218 family)